MTRAGGRPKKPAPKAKRQIFEEFGLAVQVYQMLQTYEIHVSKQGNIPGIRFLCLADQGKVRLNKREFSRCRWVDINPVPDLDWIGGVKEALDTIKPEILPDVGVSHVPRKPTRKQQVGFTSAPSHANAS